jgi:hypothetical protein|eukprot:COSAG06_NODE_203_length_20332_cov_14.679978_7_plen_162_part_00
MIALQRAAVAACSDSYRKRPSAAGQTSAAAYCLARFRFRLPGSSPPALFFCFAAAAAAAMGLVRARTGGAAAAAKVCIDSIETRPSASKATPSFASMSRFRNTEGADSPQLPLKPPSHLVVAMTRCQGTGFAQPVDGDSGLRRIDWPTARAQDPSAAATPP